MPIVADISEVIAVNRTIEAAGARIGARAATLLRVAGHSIERDAKASAPVDTGALRGSISTTTAGDGRSGSMSVEVGPTVEYGAYVELGTSRMGAQPYLAPAFDNNVEAFTDSLATMAAEGIL